MNGIVLATELIDAVSHQQLRHRLQTAIEKANGNLVLILQHYEPLVLDVFAHIVAKYGFTATIDGVIGAIQTIQLHATRTEDEKDELQSQLVAIRRILMPTGAWIQEDALADQQEQARKAKEQEIAAHKALEAAQMEQLAAENARKARIRVKKLAMGLDPNQIRLPVLTRMPPTHVILPENHALPIKLQVHAQFAQSFQWFCNGKPLETEEFGITGIDRPALTIHRLTKRVVGEYYVLCENDDGAVRSSSCQVAIAAIHSKLVTTRKLKRRPSSQLIPLTPQLLASCVAGAFVVCDATSLQPLRLLPPISAKHTPRVVAWNALGRVLALGSPDEQLIDLYALDFSQVEKHKGKEAPTIVTQALGAFEVPLTKMATLAFLDGGKWLVGSDLTYTIGIYAVGSTIETIRLLQYPAQQQHRIECVATTANRAAVAVAFRDQTHIDVYRNAVDASVPIHRIQRRFRISCLAFDPTGFALATAEVGCLKAWVSIHNIETKRVSNKRFLAHMGRITQIQWLSCGLLLTGGHDGAIKLWDPRLEALVFDVHIDLRGVVSCWLMEQAAVVHTVGGTQPKLETRALWPSFLEFVTSRHQEQHDCAIEIQKRWKGIHTRMLIQTFLRTQSR